MLWSRGCALIRGMALIRAWALMRGNTVFEVAAIKELDKIYTKHSFFKVSHLSFYRHLMTSQQC